MFVIKFECLDDGECQIVGIQLGGIGAMATGRRHDLARLGMRALFVGFTASLLNAAMAGLLNP